MCVMCAFRSSGGALPAPVLCSCRVDVRVWACDGCVFRTPHWQAWQGTSACGQCRHGAVCACTWVWCVQGGGMHRLGVALHFTMPRRPASGGVVAGEGFTRHTASAVSGGDVVVMSGCM